MKRPTLSYYFPASSGLSCPRGCFISSLEGPSSGRFVRHASYFRTSDRTYVTRFRCRRCRVTFSRATFHPCFGQKKRQLNFRLWDLLCSSVTERRAASLLGINRKTVARRVRFFGHQSVLRQSEFLDDLRTNLPLRSSVQFDEMESFEHTKCKPLSIPLLVDTSTRLILSVDVCQMPAHGRLAEISRRKYGPTPNERIPTLRRSLKYAERVISPQAEFRSDCHPYYPPVIRQLFPEATHQRTQGRRPAAIGQGELKEGGWDPLFSLNHTAAMFRANVSRLVRKTWSTTKKRERLKDRLAMYAVWHNTAILESINGPPSG